MGPSPCYIDGEQKVKAHIGGLTQPNPAGIRLEPNPNGKGPRGIMLNLLTDCEDVLTDGCAKIIPDELKNFSVVAPWVVRAGAYTHSDDPQLIVVGDSKNYLFRITVPSGGVRWVIELASSLAPAGDNGSRGAICGETGQDVTVTGVLDTNGDGSVTNGRSRHRRPSSKTLRREFCMATPGFVRTLAMAWFSWRGST